MKKNIERPPFQKKESWSGNNQQISENNKGFVCRQLSLYKNLKSMSDQRIERKLAKRKRKLAQLKNKEIKEAIKDLVIARLEVLPSDKKFSIG